MARPRVFISSTYYDLKSIRAELDRFIAERGYEPVRHEQGHIAYGVEDKLEKYAYREVGMCDILVCIIGGKYGSASFHAPYSITQKELKTALESGKQVYIFVERPVHEEYRFYKNNKALPGAVYTAVNDPKVYEFLDEIYALPSGNPIFSFDTSQEIFAILQEQWAGLFQRLLIESSARTTNEMVGELQRSLQTVGQLIEYLTEEKNKGDDVIQEILLANHPAFEQLRSIFRVKYRIYFTNIKELSAWLTSARHYSEVAEENWDTPDFIEWVKFNELKDPTLQEQNLLKINKEIFDTDDSLKTITAAKWQTSWIRLETAKVARTTPSIDGDIPF